jgi:hypothetical protein
MPRYTSAYGSFTAEVQEVHILRVSATALERSDPVRRRAEINALCRSAIVLLSAKLEAYVKDLGEVALQNLHTRAVPRNLLVDQFYYHLSKDLIDEIRDTSDPIKLAQKFHHFIQREAVYWKKIGPFQQPLPVERFNKGFSNPKVDKISAYLNRFGYSGHKRDLAIVLTSDYNATINMVDHLVDVRNKIAHGDPTATKPPADVKDMITIVKRYCATTDLTFANWCSSNLCTIR